MSPPQDLSAALPDPVDVAVARAVGPPQKGSSPHRCEWALASLDQAAAVSAPPLLVPHGLQEPFGRNFTPQSLFPRFVVYGRRNSFELGPDRANV